MLYSVYDRGLNDALQRRLGIKDDVGVNLMPELAAVLDIDREEELQYFLGWRTWNVSFGFAALAANAMELQFQNPPTSGLICLLEEITVSSTAADTFCTGEPGTANNAALTTPILVHGIRDGRMKSGIGASPGSPMLISTQQAAAVFGPTGRVSRRYVIPANTSFTLPSRPWTLIPGTTILMGFAGVNVQQTISLTWRERVGNDQELSP